MGENLLDNLGRQPTLPVFAGSHTGQRFLRPRSCERRRTPLASPNEAELKEHSAQ
jgi:hypothetical protein